MIRSTTWQEIVGLLAPAHNYWLTTVDSAGAPRPTPVWGAVHEDAWWMYSRRGRAKALHIERDPRVALTLESGDDAVIVHGALSDTGHPLDHDEVMESFRRKYVEPRDVASLPTPESAFDVLYRLEPTAAMAWSIYDMEATNRRWKARS